MDFSTCFGNNTACTTHTRAEAKKQSKSKNKDKLQTKMTQMSYIHSRVGAAGFLRYGGCLRLGAFRFSKSFWEALKLLYAVARVIVGLAVLVGEYRSGAISS